MCCVPCVVFVYCACVCVCVCVCVCACVVFALVCVGQQGHALAKNSVLALNNMFAGPYRLAASVHGHRLATCMCGSRAV